MKTKKVSECDKPRVPLAQGDVSGREFTLSIFIDGTGCILEFEDGVKYILETVDILAEILTEVKKDK